MIKLFALEEEQKDHLENNELLIDKVLNYAKQEKSPMSLTADILTQRKELKKEINDKLNEPPEDDSSEGDDNDSDENSDDNQDNENTDDNGSKDDDGKKDDASDSDAADDKDSLKSLVGSGLSDSSKGESKKEEETATESFKTKLTLSNIFAPIRDHYTYYSTALETFNLSAKKLALEEQPIVYVKEAVEKSLNNLVTLANSYIDNNTTFAEKIAGSVKELNEKLTIFRQFVENEKFHFTNKLINDKDILSNVSCPGKSDITETARILLNYVEDSTKANALVINNEFNKLSSGYTTSNFQQEEGDLVYKTALPGFNIIRLHLEPYVNYLKTDIQEYQYYKLKVLKTEDLYNLEAITISEDREINRLLDTVDKLLVNISLTTDNLKDINTHFTKFIDDIKVIIFDIEKDKYKDLASIDIDSKVQDFIKFKLVIESSYININTMIEYMTSVMSVLNICVELKD